MGFFGRLFPYSNLHDLNLDWIMQQIQDLQAGSAEALAQILAQGVSGTEFHWAATLDELIVRDAQDQELYRIKWDGDGFTLTQAGGTPLTYRVSNGTLTAPTVNGTVLRGGSAAITGEVTCGTITPTNPVDVAHGGTGATTAAAARSNLGAMEDTTVPIAKGGTGATTAAAARANLGAMEDATVPIAKGGTGATSAAAARTALGAVAKAGDTMTGDLTISKSTPFLNLHNGDNHGGIYENSDGRLMLRQFSPDQTKYRDYRLPAVSNDAVSGALDVLTSAQLKIYSATAGSDGLLGAAVHDSGMYMILVRDTNNYGHYWWGIVNKADSAVPAVTMLANDTITYTNGNTFGSLYMSGASAYTWTSYKLV